MTLPAETVVTSAHAARFESALGVKSSAHLNEDWVPRGSIEGATQIHVCFWWFQTVGSVVVL